MNTRPFIEEKEVTNFEEEGEIILYEFRESILFCWDLESDKVIGIVI